MKYGEEKKLTYIIKVEHILKLYAASRAHNNRLKANSIEQLLLDHCEKNNFPSPPCNVHPTKKIKFYERSARTRP